MPTTTPTRSSTSLCGYADPLMNHHSQSQPLSSSLGSQTNTTVSKPTASSHGQVLVGANVINITASPMSVIPQSPGLTTDCDSTPKPFFLKIKTNQVRICQSCRKDYSGPNDTMGLVARAERRLVSNLSTGAQFLGRESNSHYHLHTSCLKLAKPSFTGEELVIPDEVKDKLTAFQKVYLLTFKCLPSQCNSSFKGLFLTAKFVIMIDSDLIIQCFVISSFLNFLVSSFPISNFSFPHS